MQVIMPIMGIVLDGEFHPEVLHITQADFVIKWPKSEPVKVDIHATECEGKINLIYDKDVIECEDMAEAQIKAACYCLEQLAMLYKRNLTIACEIDTLTSA
jgi:hypothetical protein